MQGWANKARSIALNRVARVLSGELESVGTPVKRVIVDARGRACTDGENVWVPMQMTEDPVMNRMMQEAILAHEAAGHLRYTRFQDWFNITKAIKAGTEDRLLHDFVNILEDARVNHLLSQDFPGSGKRLDATQAYFMQKHREQWDGQPAEMINARQAAMVAMMTEAIAHQPHFFNHVPEVVAYMDEVRSICATAVSQPTTAAVIVQAKRMLKIYRKHFPEDMGEGDEFGMPSGESGEGIMMDDMSPEEIERMAKEQKERGAQVEEAPRRRFKDLKEKMDEVAEKAQAQKDAQEASESDESGSGDESTGEGEEDAQGASEGDSEGDSEEGSDGEGSEGDSGEGDSGSGDADGEGDNPADADGGELSDESGSSEPTGADETKTDGHLDELPESTENGDKGWGGESDDLWAEINEAMEAEMQEAHDLKKDFKEDCEDAASSGPEAGSETDSKYGDHTIEITHTTQSFIERADLNPEFNLSDFATAYNATVAENRTAITTLVNEMKRLIKGRDTKYQRGLKRGGLDSRRLWMHRTNDRLFQKRVDPDVAEANVVVLIDSSGSMGGTRSQEAARAATVFAEVFDRLGFGCEIVDFCTMGRTAIRVRKSMKAPVNEITKAAIAAPTAGGSNSDGYALQWCIDRVSTFKGNRMVFVISDGQPAGPAPSGLSCDDHLKAVVEDCPKDIGLFSVGIDGMDTSEYYENAVRVDDCRTLVKDSMPIIRKMLRRVKKVNA